MRNEPLPQSARVPIQLLSVNRSARFLFARAMKGLGPFAFPPSSLERIEMRATKRWVTAVDDWRRHQPDRPSRGEAIRRLVEQSLVASKPARRPDQNARAAAASYAEHAAGEAIDRTQEHGPIPGDQSRAQETPDEDPARAGETRPIEALNRRPAGAPNVEQEEPDRSG